jgi:hypothetical protein
VSSGFVLIVRFGVRIGLGRTAVDKQLGEINAGVFASGSAEQTVNLPPRWPGPA